MEPAKQTENEIMAVNLRTLKDEVDALQIAFDRKDRPWYQDGATIISVLALIFSFGTTWVSSRKADAQDIENQRIELRGLLQRMAELPKQNLEAMESTVQIPERWPPSPGTSIRKTPFSPARRPRSPGSCLREKSRQSNTMPSRWLSAIRTISRMKRNSWPSAFAAPRISAPRSRQSGPTRSSCS